MRKVFENSTSYFTVVQALDAMKENIYFEVNDGKDITVFIDIEKEPTANRFKKL